MFISNLHSVKTEDIAYIYSNTKSLISTQKVNIAVLHISGFIHINAVNSITMLQERKITLESPVPENIVNSSDKTPVFVAWLDR